MSQSNKGLKMTYTYIDEDVALDRYRDEIDQFNEVKIFGMSFCASRVLEELDPIAFNCGFSDWLDANEITTDEREIEND
jgi:hypothetical protein